YGALVAGAAAGAVLAQLGGAASLRPVIGWAGLAGGVLAVGILELLPLVSGAIGGQPFIARAVVLGVVLVPIGLCLGVPLAGAIRLLGLGRRGGWAALLVAVALLAAMAGRYLAYALGLSWTLSVPTALSGVCLFGAFLMAGLRALTLPADDRPVEPASTADHTVFRRPADASSNTPEAPVQPPASDATPRTGIRIS
ncbi:MAG TPA: hypothetical protein VFX49_04255, partial [Chloroflexota bacterium]|nr:hypothetical protein [Chloroflexota bacterium]